MIGQVQPGIRTEVNKLRAGNGPIARGFGLDNRSTGDSTARPPHEVAGNGQKGYAGDGCGYEA